MRAYHYFSFLCFLLLLVQFNAVGQTAVFEKPRINVAQGLPQSYVSGLVQDQQGFIWIATRDGLARYDGREFKVYTHRPGDTTTIVSNVIADIFLDNVQQLWI